MGFLKQNKKGGAMGTTPEQWGQVPKLLVLLGKHLQSAQLLLYTLHSSHLSHPARLSQLSSDTNNDTVLQRMEKPNSQPQ